MKYMNRYTIGALAIALSIVMIWFGGRASAPAAPKVEDTLQADLSTWSSQYVQKAEEKKQHEAATVKLNAELRELSCKALATRMALCQRGSEANCKGEQDARAAMTAGYGAPYEEVCKKDFTAQVTGS